MSDLLQYTIKKDGEHQKELIECIELKNKEIQRLKEEYMILQNASDEVEEEQAKEIERLKNNWNKLEEEISKHIALCTDITLNDILDLMQELKGRWY